MATPDTTFLAALSSGETLVSDGATGTNLQAAGLAVGQAAEAWVLKKPEAILDLHRQFVDAGSDIILSCSFGGNKLCNDAWVREHAKEVNTQAAALARSVADEAGRRVFVGGSMGPTGKMLVPLGTLEPTEVEVAYAEQSAALEAGGVDFLILETFYDLVEAKAAIAGVKLASSLPLVCSFSYDRGERTMMGVSPETMASEVAPLGVVAIGANCGTTPEDMGLVLEQLAGRRTGLPLWIKPNAGLPTGTPPRYDISPVTMATHIARYTELGAQVVGGCCGNTPAHVAAIADLVKNGRV